MNLRAIGNKVIVEPLPPATQTPGGLHLLEQYQLPTGLARVLSVGNGRHNRRGVLVPIDLKPGDIVQYRWIDGREIEWDGRMLKALDAEEIIGLNSND